MSGSSADWLIEIRAASAGFRVTSKLLSVLGEKAMALHEKQVVVVYSSLYIMLLSVYSCL